MKSINSKQNFILGYSNTEKHGKFDLEKISPINRDNFSFCKLKLNDNLCTVSHTKDMNYSEIFNPYAFDKMIGKFLFHIKNLHNVNPEKYDHNLLTLVDKLSNNNSISQEFLKLNNLLLNECLQHNLIRFKRLNSSSC